MTKSPDIKIRRAVAGDIEAITDLHRASFSGNEHVPVMLGRRYVKATITWQVVSAHAYMLVAEAEGRIVGFFGVCDSAYAWPMFKSCLRSFVVSLLRNPFLLFEKTLWTRLVRHSGDAYDTARKVLACSDVAQGIIGAVDAQFRGHGIFARLMESTMETSSARGSKAIVGGVYRENSSSRRVFIKSGWIEIPCPATSETVFYVAMLDTVRAKEIQKILESAGPTA